MITDGSEKDGKAGIAVVWNKRNKYTMICEGVKGRQTSQNAEIYATYKGIKNTSDTDDVLLFTDSMMTIKIINQIENNKIQNKSTNVRNSKITQ